MTTEEKQAHIKKICQPKKKGELPKKVMTPEEIANYSYPKIIGYVGKAKGAIQILVERGWYHDNMQKPHLPSEMKKRNISQISDANNLFLTLSRCPDFKHEQSAIHMMLEDEGFICLLSPKCHPELAGEGVEYCIGNTKMYFRRKTNTTIASELKSNVLKAVNMINAKEATRMHYPRRCREYMRLYRKLSEQLEQGADGKITEAALQQMPTFEKLEQMVRHQPTHRNIEELDRDFLRKTAEENGQDLDLLAKPLPPPMIAKGADKTPTRKEKVAKINPPKLATGKRVLSSQQQVGMPIGNKRTRHAENLLTNTKKSQTNENIDENEEKENNSMMIVDGGEDDDVEVDDHKQARDQAKRSSKRKGTKSKSAYMFKAESNDSSDDDNDMMVISIDDESLLNGMNFDEMDDDDNKFCFYG